MLRFMSLAGLVVIWLVLLTGCPLSSTDPTPNNSDGGADQAQDTGAVDTGSQSDTLEQRFPGCGEPANADSWRDQVWQLLNSERTRNSLEPLARNAVLDAEAEQYACEMIYYDFFAHENPVTGSDLATRAANFAYDYWMIGENLAAGQTSPAQVVTDWMNSPGHRENMLHDGFTEVGLGVRSGGDYGLYWVLEFGQPR